MSIGTAIFNPKLLVPRRGNKIIRRERLIDILHDNVQTRIQVLSAPTGYGKTTLLTNFAQDLGAPICWYTIDATDEDPRVLLEGILASICSRFPNFGHQTNSRLLSTTDLTKDATQLLNTLAAEISSDIADFFVLVLDDYHFLQNSEPARLLLNLFLERTPDNCHVIISSRTQVELPVISKTVLQNPAAIITVSQLSLTSGETKDLVAAHYGIDLSIQEADKLTQHTGGWIIGVLSGVHSLREGKLAVQMPAISQEDVSRYLTSEVYDKQPPAIQSFLLASSTLDDLSPEICDQLLPSINSRKILRLLDQQNLFMQCIDENKKWYRYHQIFKDFLQAKLLEDDPAQFTNLHSVAGSVYEHNQRWNEAVKHYATAGKYDEAVRVIKAVGADFFKSGKWTTISKWLDMLPDALRTSDPEMVILDAQTLAYIGRVDEAVHILSRLIGGFSGEKDWLLKAKALSWRSAAFRLNGYFREARADIGTSIRLLEQHQGPAELLGDAHRRLGDIHAEQGRFPSALRHLQRALRCYSSVLDIGEIARVHNSLGITYKRLGQLARAKMHFEKARAGWLKTKNFGALAIALNNIGLIYQRMGEYNLALETFRSSLEKAKETGYRRVEAGILISIADVLRDMGQYQEAMPVYQEGLELARQLMESSFVAYATAGIGETYRLQGEREKAEILLKEAQHQAEEQEQPYEAALFSIPLGIIEYERGRFERAVAVLNDASQRLETLGDRDALAKVYFHLAQASFLTRKYDSAIEWLEKVSVLADELGYEDFLAIEGRNAIPLIQYGAEKGIGSARFFRILDKIGIIGKRRTTGLSTGISIDLDTRTKPDIEVRALIHTQVTISNRRVSDADWRSNRAKEIFFYLLTYRGGRTKEQITAALWPDLSPARGTSNLHINLFRARRALYPGIFIFEDGCYKINPNLHIWFDVAEFENLLAVAEATTSPITDRASALERALELCGGTFLEELYSEWIEDRRRELENKYLRVLSLLADYYASRGNYSRAVALLEKFIAIDPYEEDAYCRIIRWHLAERNRSLALRTYKQYVELAADENKSESSYEIRRLYQRIVAGGPASYIQN
jgi:ATP/maltotriose-dependent transcriptional regulator MalT/DNA-binding SARP family transcriptional activator